MCTVYKIILSYIQPSNTCCAMSMFKAPFWALNIKENSHEENPFLHGTYIKGVGGGEDRKIKCRYNVKYITWD